MGGAADGSPAFDFDEENRMAAFTDYKVADINLAKWGRSEIAIAET